MLRRWIAIASIALCACDLDAVAGEVAREMQRTAERDARRSRRRGDRPTPPPPPPAAPVGRALPSGTAQTALGVPRDRSPQDELLLAKPQYVVSYNPFRNVANWAAWRLTAADLGDTGRTRDRFAPDPQLPDGVYRAVHNDYRGTGYDRGHLVPSAHRTADPDDNAATFLMTNILPQRHDLNAGAWEALEEWSINMARAGWDLYHYAGGLYPAQCATDRAPQGNSPDPSCESVGRSDDIARRVGVPTSTWKVIVLLPRGGGVANVTPDTPVVAVDMPNDGSAGHDWRRYVISVDELERRTGYDFLPAVPEPVQSVVESRAYRGE